MIFVVRSEIVNNFARKGGAQGIQYGEDINEYLCDGTAHRAAMAGSCNDLPIHRQNTGADEGGSKERTQRRAGKIAAGHRGGLIADNGIL